MQTKRVFLGVTFLLLLVGWTQTWFTEVRAESQQSVAFSGQVLDPQDRVIPGVEVHLRREGTDFSSSALTDDEGRFQFPDLPGGEFVLTVQFPGFQTYRSVQEIAQSMAGVIISLEIQSYAQEVIVTATMPEFATELTVGGQELEERGAQDLAQFLRQESGLSAFRRGSINFEPTIRGLQENEVGQFVDGTRTFAAGPARMDSDISHVNPHTVQTIRAVKGPYALNWGAGTLSAVQIETFRPPFYGDGIEIHGRAGFNYGKNASSGDGYGSFWGANDRVRFLLFYGLRTGNDYRAGNDEVITADFESHDLNWSLGFLFNPETLLEYSGGYQEQHDIDFPGRLLDATYFFTRSHSWALTWTPRDSSLWEINAQIYVNRKDHLMNNDNKPTAQPNPSRMPPFPIRVDLPTESNTLGGNFDLLLEDRAWDLRVGFDFYNSDQNANRSIFRRDQNVLLFHDIVWPDVDLNDQGIFGQVLYDGERAQVGGTLRLDWVQSSAGEVSDFFRENTSGRLDQTETNFSAALSGKFKVSDFWLISAGLGRSVRTAAAAERYSDRFPSTKFQISAEFMGNPALEPEKALELSLGSEISFQGVFIQVDTFYREIDDYITVVPDPSLPKRLPLSPPTVYRYVNGTEARFYGAEVELRQSVGAFLEWRGSLSYVWAEDDLLNEPVIGIPPLHGRLGLRIHSSDPRFWLDLTATLMDKQSRVAFSRFERLTPGYAVFDLRGGLQLQNDWLFKAGLENLGDRHYSNHLNSVNPFSRKRIPEMGRNFYVGLEFTF